MDNYKWCAIDAEGDVGDKGLLGVAYFTEIESDYLTDNTDIKNMLLKYAKDGYTFLAHNAEYDLPVIFWQLKIPMKAVYYNKKFNRGEWQYHKRKAKCELWDTLSLAGMISVKTLGESIGLPKYETPQRLLGIDPNKYNWICEAHRIGECEKCYAIRDAEIIYRFMIEFSRTLGDWGIKPQRRLGTAAVNTWRMLDNPTPIHIHDRRIKELSRQAYYGGRVEAFKVGTVHNVYEADVQSMYPSVMLETAMPDPNELIMINSPRLDAINWNCNGVAEVEIYVPQMYLPPLPYSHENQRTFPVGLMRGSWTTLELRYALSLGCIINKVYKLAFSTGNVFPFSNYIGALWELRQQYKRKGDSREIVIKLLLNNLYGRLGMNEELTEERVFIMPPDSVLSDFPGCNGRMVNGQMYIHEPRKVKRMDDKEEEDRSYLGEIPPDVIFKPNYWANVMWAAYITAAARVKLHKYLSMQGTNIIYCDTDSVFSLAPIEGASEGLGSLQQKGHYQTMLIAGPKLYWYEGYDGIITAKAKGVAKSVAKDFIDGKAVTFPSPVKPRTQQIRGIAAGTWITLERQRHLVPGSRQLQLPSVTTNHELLSDTLPLVISPSGEVSYTD